MRANKPGTKILVDGGDPEETLRTKELIGFVDGQTTNPSLIAKSPEVQQLLASLASRSRKKSTRRSYRRFLRLWATRGFPLKSSLI
jgi:transaldolase